MNINMKIQDCEIKLILPDIRSAHNVGAIFRTADAFGVSKILISGYTPTPIDRFGRERNDISKASLGAQNAVSWEEIDNIIEYIKKSKEEGFEVVSLEISPDSVQISEYQKKKKIILVVGNEINGIDKDILEISDQILEIPMMGQKESMNVSVSTGIALYALSN